MSDRLIQVLGTEAEITTATNVGNAHCVRLYHAGGSDTLVTIKNSGGTTLGTFTLKSNDIVFVKKAPTDTITCADATKGVAVGLGD
jgi:hypothetical protein